MLSLHDKQFMKQDVSGVFSFADPERVVRVSAPVCVLGSHMRKLKNVLNQSSVTL